MRTLTALLLVALSLPASAAIHFSAESPIGPAQLGPTSTDNAQIATDGEIHVAVWVDYRRSPLSVYAARFRRDGTLLDPVGILIAPGARAGTVLWSGDSFLVAYVHENTIRVRSLSTDGTLGAPIDLFGSSVPAESYKLRMATNGDSVLLVTSDSAAALLERDGRMRRQLAMPWPSVRSGIGVAAAGSAYLVAAGADLKVKTQLVHANGDLGPEHALLRGDPFGVDVASDGERFLVSWAHGHLQAAFVERSGVPVAPVLTPTPAATPVPHPWFRSVIDLVWRGSEYLLIYAQNGEAYLPLQTLRITAAGAPAGPLFAGDDWQIANVVVAPNGSSAVIGWNRGILSGAFLDAQGSSLRGTTRVALAARSQRDVRLAAVPGGIAAAWLERDHENGTALQLSRGPGSTPVSVAGTAEALVDVVAENQTIWVLWSGRDATLYARRYTLALQPIDAEPVAVGKLDASGVDSSAAAGGGSVIVVSANPHGGSAEPSGPHLVAHVLRGRADGITSSVSEVASEPGLDHDPAVAWNGAAFVVAWANALGYSSGAPAAIRTNDVYTGFFPDDRILTLQLDSLGRRHAGAPVEIARSKAIETLGIAHGARGTAVAWQPYLAPDASSRRHTYAALAVPQSAVIDLGGQDQHLGAFTAHDGGFLLARAAVNATARIAQPEVLELDAFLRTTDRAQLAPYVIDVAMQRRPFDADLAGGPVASFAYARVADGIYGDVSRHFVRRLLESQRRRTSRK